MLHFILAFSYARQGRAQSAKALGDVEDTYFNGGS